MAYSIQISVDPWKEKITSKIEKHVAGKNKTRIWRVGLEGGGDGETELEALPHPISFSVRGNGVGDKGAACGPLTPDFWTVGIVCQKGGAPRSEPAYWLCKHQIITRKKIRCIFIGAANTCCGVGPGRRRLRQWGRGPRGSDPLPSPAPAARVPWQNYFSLPCRTRSKPPASAQFGESRITGVRLLAPVCWVKAPGVQGRALHHPLAPSQPPPLGNSLASLAHRPITAARTARPALRRAPDSETRPTAPSPPPRRVRPPTCRPSLSRVLPRASGPEDPERASQRRGGPGRIRFPLPRRAGKAPPSLQAEPCPCPRARSGNTPSPRGPDLRTWAGLALSPSPRPFSRLPARIQIPHPKKVPRPEPGAGKAAVAVARGRAEDPPVCPPRLGAEKEILRLPPCHPPWDLPSPSVSPGPLVRPLPLPSFSSTFPLSGSSWAGAALSLRTPTLRVQQPEPRVWAILSPGENPWIRFSADPWFPQIPVFSQLPSPKLWPSVPDSRGEAVS